MDFSIWEILVVGIVVLSFFGDRNSKKRKRHRTVAPPAAEPAIPQPSRTSHPQPTLRPLGSGEMPQPFHPDSQETLMPEIEWTQTATRSVPKSPKKRPKNAEKRVEAQVTPAAKTGQNRPNTDGNALVPPVAKTDSAERELLADFDLRKAVIWSEILQPKFADEE